jgi:hypothetical protein
VFLWHPVFSFILPVLCFEVLADPGGMLPAHRHLLAQTAGTRRRGLAIIAIGATFLAFNAHGNLPAAVGSIVGSAILIGGLRRITTERYGQYFSVEAMRLGRRSMAALVIYLAALYGLGFIMIRPQYIAPPMTVLLTLGVYGLVAWHLYRTRPDEAILPATSSAPRTTTPRDLLRLLIRLVVLTTVACLLIAFLPMIANAFVIVLYLALVVLAPMSLARAVWSTWRGGPPCMTSAYYRVKSR